MFYLYADISEIDPACLPVKGLTIDVENVLTDGIDGGDPTVRPEGIEFLQRVQEAGKRLILLTGCKDEEFVRDVQEQVNSSLDQPIAAIYRGFIDEAKGKRWPGKHRPAMFYAAANTLRMSGRHMGHVDDQFKSHIGALRAGYAANIWPMPWGEHEHAGVEKFRGFEMTAIRGLIKNYHSAKSFASGITT